MLNDNALFSDEQVAFLRAMERNTPAYGQWIASGESFGFSWRECECCGSGLGSDRYSALLRYPDGFADECSVCVDCLLFMANGDMPETWSK